MKSKDLDYNFLKDLIKNKKKLNIKNITKVGKWVHFAFVKVNSDLILNQDKTMQAYDWYLF